MSKRIVAYLGLGANLGDPMNQLRQAINLLHHCQGVSVRRVSSLYETSPVGYKDQPNFYNLVVEVETILSPIQLLHSAQRIEKQLHRVRKERFGPRTIDVDILLYEDRIIQEPDLIVPHPRLTERAFVLIPLKELTGDFVLPDGQQLDVYIDRLPEDQWIQKIRFKE